MTKVKDSINDKIFNIFNFLFATIFFIAVLYPIIYVLSASFSDPVAVIQGRVKLLPVGFSFAGYNAVFKHKMIISGYLNSIWYMFVGTALNIVMTILAAYPLSRQDFADRGKIMMLFSFTMLFSGGLIPSYLLIRNLGLIDSRWVLIIPGAFGVYNVVVTRTFFQNTIPQELLESAQIDGCSDIKFVLSVVIPLSGPIIAVQFLQYALGHWNTYFSAMLYLNTPSKYPLQVILREILVLNQLDSEMLTDIQSAQEREYVKELLKYSLIVVSSLPFMVIYPFVQKFFVKGMLVGSIKG